MARLNDQPAPSTDNLESLRRRFLRQNREIARINSTQSLRIRQLENECARLLSENLDLHGQVLRLENELEDNSARRTADQALQIKSKLEAQLAELTMLVAGLGVEPPSKRRIPPENHRLSKSRTSRSPPHRRLRDVAKDQEALAVQAMQEGRMPPIYENKIYPRATMNSAEILALCSEAADDQDSPDLGPPPISRFVDEDILKPDSPSKVTNQPLEPEKVAPTTEPREAESQEEQSQPRSAFKDDAVKEPSSSQNKPDSPIDTSTSQTNASNRSRAGGKRKFGDENEHVRATGPYRNKSSLTKREPQRTASSKEAEKPRTIRRPPASQREVGEGGSSQKSTLGTRRPLAPKNSNETLSSPIKKSPAESAKAEVKREAASQDMLKTNQPTQPLEIPPPELERDAKTPQPETPLVAQGTPIPRVGGRDTPPPADISADGETSRGTRRSRPTISYAEPNLRDKMRRPTKQLVDAVFSCERKCVSRAVPQLSDETASSTAMKLEHDSVKDWKSLPVAEAVAGESEPRESTTSPLRTVQAASSSDMPTATGVTERTQRRASSAAARKSLAVQDVVSASAEPDVYDISSSPVTSEPKEEVRVAPSRVSSRRGSRHLSATVQETDVGVATAEAALGGKSRAPAPRKTVSATGSKRLPPTAASRESDHSGDDAAKAASSHLGSRDRPSRRRTMMM